jgi:hypothetical protein
LKYYILINITMATPLKDGVSLIGSIIFNIIRNGIAGNEKNSDSESSS